MLIKHTIKTTDIKLTDIDPADTGRFKSKSEALEALDGNIAKLSELQEKLFAAQEDAVLIILQGMDTSGKDSLIKHALSGLNPQGCTVHSFKVPNSFELAHDYMWRYADTLPLRGMIKIFNRSYYEETTAVRVHPDFLKLRGLTETSDLWQRRYGEFNHFEDYLVHNRIKVIKVFLHISKDEQLLRLKSRLEMPEKHWKFDISDIREREHWHQYMTVYEETMSRTNTDYAPWHVIPANTRWYARLKFSQILVDELERLHLRYPEVSGEKKQAIDKAIEELSLRREKLS